MKTKQVNSIKDLGVTLEELYNEEGQINLHLSDKPFVFTVIMMGRDKRPDCKLSSFGANLWTRTEKGQNYDKYTHIQDLQTALKRLIHSRVETEGEITFSLSSEIFTI